MRTLSDLQKINSARFSMDVVEQAGDESLISDVRSRVKSTELVERKLQVALQCHRVPACSLEPTGSN
jgi:hypothetical protein